MASRTRSWILSALVVVIVLATLPSAIRGIVQTGDLYLFTRQFFEDMFARLSGTGRLRFIFQPTAAILLGSRDGLKDARMGLPSYLWALAFHGEHRRAMLRTMLASLRDLVAVAILLDIVSQFLIFREIHPGAAILLGPVLIGIPYAVSRTFVNYIVKGKVFRATSTHAHRRRPARKIGVHLDLSTNWALPVFATPSCLRDCFPIRVQAPSRSLKNTRTRAKSESSL